MFVGGKAFFFALRLVSARPGLEGDVEGSGGSATIQVTKVIIQDVNDAYSCGAHDCLQGDDAPIVVRALHSSEPTLSPETPTNLHSPDYGAYHQVLRDSKRPCAMFSLLEPAWLVACQLSARSARGESSKYQKILAT